MELDNHGNVEQVKVKVVSKPRPELKRAHIVQHGHVKTGA